MFLSNYSIFPSFRITNYCKHDTITRQPVIERSYLYTGQKKAWPFALATRCYFHALSNTFILSFCFICRCKNRPKPTNSAFNEMSNNNTLTCLYRHYIDSLHCKMSSHDIYRPATLFIFSLN